MLPAAHEDAWQAPDMPPARLRAMPVYYPAEPTNRHRLDDHVNSDKNDDADCLKLLT